MTVRILADREPYASYTDFYEGPSGPFIVLNGPAGLDDPGPDYIVLPAEEFFSIALASGVESFGVCGFIAYGPVELMEKAFNLGCEDYLREPWALAELRARLGRMARLSFRVEGRVFEIRGRRLIGGKEDIELDESEYSLISLLLKNSPLPVPHKAAEHVLSVASGKQRLALNRCVSSLRRKMERLEVGLGSRLRAIRGFGYRLDL